MRDPLAALFPFLEYRRRSSERNRGESRRGGYKKTRITWIAVSSGPFADQLRGSEGTSGVRRSWGEARPEPNREMMQAGVQISHRGDEIRDLVVMNPGLYLGLLDCSLEISRCNA